MWWWTAWRRGPRRGGRRENRDEAGSRMRGPRWARWSGRRTWWNGSRTQPMKSGCRIQKGKGGGSNCELMKRERERGKVEQKIRPVGALEVCFKKRSIEQMGVGRTGRPYHAINVSALSIGRYCARHWKGKKNPGVACVCVCVVKGRDDNG